MASEPSSRRLYVYELDPLRVVTAFCVVAVHTLGFTLGLNQTTAGMQVQNAFVTALHFTREVFMFVTAFALVYVYYHKPFSAKDFWAKRAIAVLLPYSIWSIIYTFWNTPSLPPLTMLKTIILNILTGNASFQLYYILLTIQFYILFPLFLLFLKRIARYPWRTLIISFIIEIVMLYVDYQTLRLGPAGSTSLGKFILLYQDRFVLLYQFFFILGGLTALYLPQVRAFISRHGKEITAGALVGLSALLIHYVLQVRVYQQPATVVLQPIIAFYSLTFIVFAFWLAYLWARSPAQDGHPKGYRIWHTLSDASFGLYLIHALTLDMLLRWMVPFMPVVWPVAIRVLLTWLVTAGSAMLLSIFFMRTPILSRLVGRARPTRRNTPRPILTDPLQNASKSTQS